MKNYIILFVFTFLLSACKNNDKATTENNDKNIALLDYASFGEKIIADDAVSAKSMAAHYKVMTPGDSIPSKMIAKVNEVCKAKGCWMTLDLGDGEEVMVKFKDYGFFMPKDIEGKEVIINGNAFVKEVPVDEQKHYAEDKRASEAEIAAITKPKRTYSFEANGVLLKQ